MLQKMAKYGFVRETHESEEDEFGRGWVAVLDDNERWFANHQDANAALIEMRATRALENGADK